MEERLQKIIAQAGLASRRQAEELIRTKQVTVNGKTAVLGDKADPARDDIRVLGERVKSNEKLRYILLYKKRGVVSSTEAQGDRPTVIDVVNAVERLYPVGRLDIDSDGLILLTNDGDLTNKLTHPRYGCEKTYKVLVQGRPNYTTLEKWRRGVLLDGIEQTMPCKVKILSSPDESDAVLQIVMREGKKHQIRRVAEQLGHPVVRLTRIQIGPIGIGNLKPGQFRDLTSNEVKILRDSAQDTKARRGPPRKPKKP